MCALLIKVPTRKKSGNLSNDLRNYGCLRFRFVKNLPSYLGSGVFYVFSLFYLIPLFSPPSLSLPLSHLFFWNAQERKFVKNLFNSLFLYRAVNYLTWFNKFPGQTVLPQLDIVYQRVGTADQCASLCFNYAGFFCKSFDYCELINTCVIGRTHILDVPKSQVNIEPMCSHYSSKWAFLVFFLLLVFYQFNNIPLQISNSVLIKKNIFTFFLMKNLRHFMVKVTIK